MIRFYTQDRDKLSPNEYKTLFLNQEKPPSELALKKEEENLKIDLY